MHARSIAAALVVGTSLFALTGCGPDQASSTGTSTTTDKPVVTGEADEGASEEKAGDDKAETAALPDMTGKGLQSAQDQAQAAGFYGLTSRDALGRDRMQAFDRNWKVCSQTPKAGDHSTDTKVDFAAVKLEETCPAQDAGAEEPRAAGAKMPDFTGKAVKVARGALDSGTSITVHDASGQDRFILMESNWQVCGQEPAAGVKLDGRPVTLSAVKFEESC
ncbi:PASTA domain-containing protein [Streptomyces alfalfae]|uniref:PASTA domain-containing protein n=1 Tax=Streptomyces alfalfae TaxID=1642299 RepID=A0A7T4PDC9_9ACTN|nr:PASTA domain-containing protein [Streptomyces alfalfae]QQC88151.1 PASTA domain-containing protein [Streptomyces alfalfae]